MRLPGKLAVGLCTLSLLAFVAGTSVRAGGKQGTKTMTLKVGDKAPAFEAEDENGKTWKSTDHVGKKVVVLYFYPADFTGGCTAQACGFRDNMGSLKSKDVEVVGVSGDTVKTHQMFKKHEKLNFTLLADDKGTLAKEFGIPTKPGGTASGVDENGQKVPVTRGVTIMRYTAVIDKSGNIAALYSVGNAGGDAKKVAEIVEKLDKK